VVLVHGYLLGGRSWEKQETALLAAGYRVITYDRRGFGASSRPSVGYDYDTLAADLAALLDALDLREAVLVGFCAGTGDVIRYLAIYESQRIRAAALLAPLPPFLPRTDDNPDGIDRAILDEFRREVIADRPAATNTYLDRSYNIALLGGTRVSDQAWQNSFHVAIGASAAAARGGAEAWLEDFRPDLVRITIPVLVVQGDRDRIMPPEATGNRYPACSAAPGTWYRTARTRSPGPTPTRSTGAPRLHRRPVGGAVNMRIPRRQPAGQHDRARTAALEGKHRQWTVDRTSSSSTARGPTAPAGAASSSACKPTGTT
jgi:non-heme chloroperoxidase